MRVIAHMVVKDEMDRYLKRCLTELAGFVDIVSIVDDGSTDGTFEYLREIQLHELEWGGPRFLVRRRPTYVPSFSQSETEFRQWAWQWMALVTSAAEGDWILAIDADELLQAKIPVTLMAKPAEIEFRERLRDSPHGCLELKVPEIWEEGSAGQLLRRVDGAWGNITARRLVRFQPELLSFASGNDRKPKTPDSVPYGYGKPVRLDDFELLHLGYLRPEDRKVKHERYTNDGRHTSSHVKSILKRPKLETWM